jgi:hypothetical protein
MKQIKLCTLYGPAECRNAVSVNLAEETPQTMSFCNGNNNYYENKLCPYAKIVYLTEETFPKEEPNTEGEPTTPTFIETARKVWAK